MATGGQTPKQGDHIFNIVDTVLLRPFRNLAAAQSPYANGQLFVDQYLLICFSWIHRVSENEDLRKARDLSASAGAEEDALREIAALSERYPALSRVQPSLLRKVHLENANHFGAAALSYEIEVLRTIQEVLEDIIGASSRPAGSSSKAGIAYQHLLNTAYDPASALVMITKSRSGESAALQGTFVALIAGLADTLDHPGMWVDPYESFHDRRETETGAIVKTIYSGLIALKHLKVPGLSLTNMIQDEIRQQRRLLHPDGAQLSGWLHLVQQQIETLRRQ